MSDQHRDSGTSPAQGVKAALFLLLLAGCGPKSGTGNPPPSQPDVPARALFTPTLAGEKIAVLPLSMVIAESPLGAEPPFIDRVGALRWADSVLGYALENRAPDVSWVLPEELRAIAKRAPTVAPDPDKMGQSIMGSPKLDIMPDPLRSYARSLVAIAGGRQLLIPAAFTFSRTPAGKVKAQLSIVLADVRNGKVIWRTLGVGEGDTPDAALNAAFKVMLPLSSDMQ